MREVFTTINASPFCRGEEGGWRANFDWALKPGNIAKVLEGNYAAGPMARTDIGAANPPAGPAVPDAAATRRMLRDLEA